MSFVMARAEAWKNEDEYSFAVVDAKTGMFLGGVGLNQVNRVHQLCNLGYWVRTSCTGRGIASAAARLAARFGLEELKLQRIEIVVATGNHYWLDGVVGIAVVAVAVVVERWARGVITRRLAARQPAGGGSRPGSDRLPRQGITV